MNACVSGTIDGQSIQIRSETTILAAAESIGLAIPTLCHHPGLPAEGVCRLCLAEISFGGAGGKLVASCMYPLRDNGFIIYTNNETVRAGRRFVLEMLINRCPASPRLLALAAEYGVLPDPRFDIKNSEAKNACRDGSLGKSAPLASLCILCGRCARACEINGVAAISLVGRGRNRKAAGPFYKNPAACVGCLSCASICPVGAIWSEEQKGVRRIWGREFKLAKCENCGEPFGTQEQIKLAAGAYYECPSCRRLETAAAFKKTLVFSGKL